MPELPEVETVRRTLAPLLTGRAIISVEARRPELIKHPEAGAFITAICGRVVTGLSRRGKYPLLHMDDGSILAAHLRMTGRLVTAEAGTAELPHTHVVFKLDDGRELRFSDTRRFGCLWLIAPGETDDFTGMQNLGREPLADDFTADYLMDKLSARHITIKQGILDQSVIAGLGNIYADEALFAAAVRPDRSCAGLSREEWQALIAAIPPILSSAIERRGTTFSDYVDGEGRKGGNQAFLQAYQRSGQPCLRCGAMMEKIRIGGRGTCFCPGCQK